MSHLWILALCVLGFACLALAMDRHQNDLFDRALGPALTKTLRTAGWVLLFGSLFMALRQPLWSISLVAWFGYLSAGAGVVFLALVLMGRAIVPRLQRRRAEGVALRRIATFESAGEPPYTLR